MNIISSFVLLLKPFALFYLVGLRIISTNSNYRGNFNTVKFLRKSSIIQFYGINFTEKPGRLKKIWLWLRCDYEYWLSLFLKWVNNSNVD